MLLLKFSDISHRCLNESLRNLYDMYQCSSKIKAIKLFKIQNFYFFISSGVTVAYYFFLNATAKTNYECFPCFLKLVKTSQISNFWKSTCAL